MMLRCKDVANALFESDYRELPWWRRMLLKMHVSLCFFCHRPHTQLMQMQDGERIYREREDELLNSGHERMDAETRARIREAMSQMAAASDG